MRIFSEAMATGLAQVKDRSLRALLALLIGALAVGGFHPFEFWPLPIASLIGMIILSRDVGLRERFFLFFLYGLGFLAPLLHWSSTYVGSFPWLILSFGFALFYSLVALGFNNGKASPALFACAFALSEGLRALFPFGGFGWGRFGFSQLGGPFQEWLRIGGVALTGFVVALSAVLLSQVNRRTLFIIPLVSVSLLGPLGLISASAAPGDAAKDGVRIGLIQGGVSQLGLDFNATPREVFDRHLEVTEGLLDNADVDLILWPENASDIDPIRNRDINKRLNELASRAGTPLVIGAVVQGSLGPENVSLLFDGSGSVVSRYQKRDLVPFGEYVPLRGIASLVSPLTDQVKDFVPANEITPHRVVGLEFAPLICYEILDDRVVWQNLSLSSIGVVQTNNATFGRSWQSGQQFQMTRVRAFESRIPFVVAATTGDTASIDSNGEVVERIPKYRSDFLIITVAPRVPSRPFFSPELILGISAMVLTIFIGRKVKARREV